MGRGVLLYDTCQELEKLDAVEFLETFVDPIVDECPSSDLLDVLYYAESVELLLANCVRQSVFDEYDDEVVRNAK